MGFTRARRYTNYKGGRKLDPETSTSWRRARATRRRRSRRIFFDAWKKAEAKPVYAKMKAEWKEKYG